MDFSNRPASIDQGGHSSAKVGDDLRSLFPQVSNKPEAGAKGGAKDARSFGLRFVVHMASSDENKTFYNCTNTIVDRESWIEAMVKAPSTIGSSSTTTSTSTTPSSATAVPTSDTTTAASSSSTTTTSSSSSSTAASVPTSNTTTTATSTPSTQSGNPSGPSKKKKKKKSSNQSSSGPSSIQPTIKRNPESIFVSTSGEDWMNRFFPDEALEKLPLPNEIVSLVLAARARWTIPLDCSLKITVLMGFRTSHVFIPRLPMEEAAPKYGGRIVLNLRHKDVYYMMMDGDTKDTEVLRTKPNKCFLLNSGEGIMLPPGLCSMTDIWLSSSTKFMGPPSNVVGDRTGKAVLGLRSNTYDRITVIIDLPLSDLLIQKITSEFGDMGGEASSGGSGGSGAPSGLGGIMKDPRLKGMANSSGIKKKINKDPGIQSAIENAVRGIKAMAPVEIETEAVSTADTIEYGLRVIGGKQSLQEAVQQASSKVPEVLVNLPVTTQASVASQMSSILGTEGTSESKTAADVLDQLSSILTATATISEDNGPSTGDK